MREAVGKYMTAGHSLQAIVANRRCSIQPFLDVATLELDAPGHEASGLRGGVSPYTGEAIGLQLDSY